MQGKYEEAAEQYRALLSDAPVPAAVGLARAQAALGQLDASNLKLSLLFVPLAIASTYAGAWIVKRMRAEVFYPMIYSFVALVAVKLIWDGLGGLLA